MKRALVMMFAVALSMGAAVYAQSSRDHYPTPAGPELERSLAETHPDSPPPPAAHNWTLPTVDGRVVAVYSLLWVLAIVIAMGALLRAEATDPYHGAPGDALEH